tara:strand:- start:383 stop:1003 length:621 start_codon:yes stop_codon:yes gene_type:complete
MAISKIQSESMNLADTFAFTGTVSGAGKILSFGSYNSGVGSGARLQTTSTSWVNLEINGDNQVIFGQITKNSDDSLNYNKVSNSSHLIISMNVPTYNNAGNGGHGFRLKFETTQNSGTYNILDIQDNGPAHGWGFHGYGGQNTAMNNCTWNTYDNSTYRSAIQSATGNVRFFWEVRVWNSSDTIYFNDHNSSYPKYSTFTVLEVAV